MKYFLSLFIQINECSIIISFADILLLFYQIFLEFQREKTNL